MSGQSVTTSTWTEHPYSRGASDRYARSRHVDGDGDAEAPESSKVSQICAESVRCTVNII